MTPAEAAALLGIAAAFDNRKPDADQAKAWSVALDGLRFADCRDAVVAHYRATSEWLMPAAVIAHVKRIRAKRLADAVLPDPPPGLSDDDYAAWLRVETRRIADGEDVVRPALPAPDPAHAERMAALMRGHSHRAGPRSDAQPDRGAFRHHDDTSADRGEQEGTR